MGNPIETAIRMETDAIVFYGEAERKCSSPYGKKMFEMMVKEEQAHLEMLKNFFGLDHIRMREQSFTAEVKTVFHTMRPEMMARVEASTDELEALKIGMEMESAGKKYYDEQAASATDDRERALFERLSSDEEAHYRIFADSFSFLSDNNDWNLWEERAIYEG